MEDGISESAGGGKWKVEGGKGQACFAEDGISDMGYGRRREVESVRWKGFWGREPVPEGFGEWLVEGWVDSDERKAEATMLKILNTALEVV